ncbi:hypothetical protein [Vreelandella sp. GE22]
MIKLFVFAFFALLVSCLVSKVAGSGQKEMKVQAGSFFQTIIGFILLAFALFFGLRIVIFVLSG